MPSIDSFAVIGIVIVFMLLGVLFLVHISDRPKKRRKKKDKGEGAEETKDWYAVSVRLEKHIYSLRTQLEKEEKRAKKLEREIIIQKDKYEKVNEKLTQERKWQRKETDEVKRKT